jgi:dienelactone hydrolase
MVTTSEVEYEADGGVLTIGHLAVPADDAGAALPAVLVAHEAPGLDEVHRERADRLAERGYVAFALDAHGGGRFRLDDPRIRERVAAISNDSDRARSIAASALEVLRVHRRVDASRMAAIGYCFTHPHADRAGIPGLAYDPAAADRAWRAMLDLFEEVIGREAAPSHS